MDSKKYSKIIFFILSISIASFALGREMVIQPWQKEKIQIPVISTTFKTTSNSAQLRLLTKYYAIEKAYTDLNSFILLLPVDTTRTINTVVGKYPQLSPALEKLVRGKSVIIGFEYSSDSSALITITLDSKAIETLFASYWKPEKPPKPAKSKKQKETVKAKPKKVKKEKAKEETKTIIDESQKPNTPTPTTPPKTDVKKEEQPPKDSATP